MKDIRADTNTTEMTAAQNKNLNNFSNSTSGRYSKNTRSVNNSNIRRQYRGHVNDGMPYVMNVSLPTEMSPSKPFRKTQEKFIQKPRILDDRPLYYGGIMPK